MLISCPGVLAHGAVFKLLNLTSPAEHGFVNGLMRALVLFSYFSCIVLIKRLYQ